MGSGGESAEAAGYFFAGYEPAWFDALKSGRGNSGPPA
jgi:hypothetical protein